MNRALLAILATILVVPGALAHAEPFEASPGWNERLEVSPREAVVQFTEPVHPDGSWILVRDLDGNRVDLDDLRIESGPRPVMRVSLPDLPDGGYLVRWQTYSQTDGHTIAGAIGFSIGAFAPPEVAGLDDEIHIGGVIGRTLTYLGYVVAIGAFAFRYGVLRRPADASLDKPLVIAGGLQLVGVAVLMLDTAVATGISWQAFLQGEGGRAFIVRLVVAFGIVALTALWSFGPVRPRFRHQLLAGLWIGAIALGARLGHAVGPAAWAMQVLHAVAISAWVGGLAWFVVWLVRRRSDEDVLAVGRRFGTLGVAATVLMVISGLYLSAVILGSALLDSGGSFSGAWRSVLSMKILLAVAMIGIAAVNKFVILAGRGESLRQRLAPTRQAGLARLAGAEVGIGVVVLVLAAILMSMAAPTDALEPTQSRLEMSATGFDFNGLLQIVPEPVGGQLHEARLYLEDFAGEPLRENSCAAGRDDCVSIAWYPVADGADAAQAAVGIPSGDGWWTFENVLFTGPGEHVLLVEASSAYAFQDELRFEFVVLQSA